MSSLALAGYRDRLAALADLGTIERRLDAWVIDRGIGQPPGWRREYGRLRPGRSPWAVLAYEAEGGRATVRVDLFHDPPDPTGIMIMDCRDDPELAGLGTVLAALDGAQIVRYRPANRCTVRGGSGPDARFVKVVAGQPDQQVDARALWGASLSGELGFAVAEPRGWDLRTRSSWYGVVPGDPIADELLGAGGSSVAERIGAALGQLARSSLRPLSSDGHAVQLARTGRAVARASAAAPALADDLDGALAVLARCHETFQPRALVPVHGAPHMHQWLADQHGRLGLVDLDRYALGEPELDLATFLVELESESDRVTAMAELKRAAVTGFETAGGRLDPIRLAVYAVHKRLAKVARTAIGLRPDGDARAARHLDSVRADLALLDRSGSRISV